MGKLAFDGLVKSDKNRQKKTQTRAFFIRTAGGKFQVSELAPSQRVLFGGVVLIVSFRSLVMNKWISVLLTKLISVPIFDLSFKKFSFNFVNLKSNEAEKNISTKRFAWQIKIYFGLKVHCFELFGKPSSIFTDLDSHRNLSGFSRGLFRG